MIINKISVKLVLESPGIDDFDTTLVATSERQKKVLISKGAGDWIFQALLRLVETKSLWNISLEDKKPPDGKVITRSVI